jgi:hypothetical protein
MLLARKIGITQLAPQSVSKLSMSIGGSASSALEENFKRVPNNENENMAYELRFCRIMLAAKRLHHG